MATTSLAAVPSGTVPSTGSYNWVEVFKFARLTVIWLVAIFGAVWITCWAAGELLPHLIEMKCGGQGPSRYVIEGLQACTPLLAILVFIPVNAMFMVLCERRALALFTVRKGPNRVGADGLLQTAADAVKLLFKEDITPRGADVVMFTLAPIIFFAPSVFAAVPLLAAVTSNHELFSITNLPTGIFYVLAMSSIPVVGIVMGGWASNNKYSLVGGLRSAAQAIAYEIPLVLSIITICFLSGTLDVVAIAKGQSDGFWHWNLLGGGVLLSVHSAPAIAAAIGLALCCLLLFGIYLTGACAEINRIPFDLPEAESELVSGYNTEYSGIKFAIFFLAEFTNLFIVSTIAAVMFLGGGASPIPGLLDATFFGGAAGQITAGAAVILVGILCLSCKPVPNTGLLSSGWFGWLCFGLQLVIVAVIALLLGGGASLVSNGLTGWPFNQLSAGHAQLKWLFQSLVNPVTFAGMFWALLKVYTLVIFAILVRGTLPRFRIDQLMDFGWKRLIPLSLILLLAVTFLRELV